MRKQGGIWVAWGSGNADYLCCNSQNEVLVPENNPKYMLKRIPLSKYEIENYYQGYTNRVLWPLFHFFIEKMHIKEEYWDAYKKTNQKFAQTVLEVYEKEDFIWIHDYHLALAPLYIRKEKPNAKIALFWHIPWPPWEIFGTLPHRNHLLKGLLNSDLIGFHTKSYVQNFFGCAKKIPRIHIEEDKTTIVSPNNKTKISTFPLGIAYNDFAIHGQSKRIIKKADQLKRIFKQRELILGVDRLDYTKGILDRIKAFEYFLDNNPHFREKVVLLQIATPSRDNITEYCDMKKEIDEAIGRINGKFGSEDWTPITYFYRKIPQDLLLAYYQAADIGLLTPIRDGMNLIAKEFTATKKDDGVLILSEFAGASEELHEAITVNPYDISEMADALKIAMEMSEDEKNKRFFSMKEKIKAHDAEWWQTNFLTEWETLYAGVPLQREDQDISQS